MDIDQTVTTCTDTTALATRATLNTLQAVALTAAGALFAAGGLLHPGGDPVAQLHAPVWTFAHGLLLAGLAALIVGAGVLWTGSAAWPHRVRTATLVLAGAAVLSTVEMVPHLLAAGEAHAVEHGGAHPLYDFHQHLGLVSNAVLGLSVAVLAVLASRGRQLGGPALAVLAVVGGLAFAAAAPLIVLTGVGELGVLFSGSVLIGLWLLAVGVGLLRRR